MVHELSYTVISHVIDSWESLRRIKNYEHVAGTMLFRKVFIKAPQVKVLFGFPIDMNMEDPQVLESKRFLMHAAYLIQMLDTALQMLGPDAELLSEIMAELGLKHVRYGVKAEMFPVMGESLIECLEETLKDSFTADVKKAWQDVFLSLTTDMMSSYKK
jgi:hemoglobin-like flavoprotein